MRSVGASILFSEMTPPAELESGFNAWYDNEHIPIRMKSAGFLGAQRYRDGDTCNYLAVYELASADALSTPTYEKIKKEPSDTTRHILGAVSGFTRYLGRQLTLRCRDGSNAGFVDAPVLFAVFFHVPDDRLAEFDAWYEGEHTSILMEDERWRGVRRFEIFDGIPHAYNRLALHYLSDRSALDSPTSQKAQATDRRARLASQPWFKGTYLLFDRLGERFEGER